MSLLLPSGLKGTVLSRSTNPYLNLALETFLFTTHPQTHILLFYRNRPTVVIGRNQNPFSQVNLSHATFLRRYSGGGTVYHDLGNANFSVRMPRSEFTRRTYAEMVVRALDRLHCIPGCRVTERGDIVMVKGEEGYKVSGSAYKVSKDMAYHHGTMLLGSNLAELRKALRIDGRIMIRDNGVDSLRAKHVANIPFPGENIHDKWEGFVRVVRSEFEEMHGKHRYVELTEDCMMKIPEIEKMVGQLNSWEWKFGMTPDFTERTDLDDKGSTIVCSVKRGLITSVDINTQSDSIQQTIPRLKDQLLNQRYSDYFLVPPTNQASPLRELL